jgi:hypothetical protein
MLTRVDSSLDRPVVLFQDVIQVRHRPLPTVFVQSAFSFEPHDRRRVRAVTIGVDDARHGMVLPSQRFGSGSALLSAAPAWHQRRKSRVAPEESTAR